VSHPDWTAPVPITNKQVEAFANMPRSSCGCAPPDRPFSPPPSPRDCQRTLFHSTFFFFILHSPLPGAAEKSPPHGCPEIPDSLKQAQFLRQRRFFVVEYQQQGGVARTSHVTVFQEMSLLLTCKKPFEQTYRVQSPPKREDRVPNCRSRLVFPPNQPLLPGVISPGKIQKGISRFTVKTPGSKIEYLASRTLAGRRCCSGSTMTMFHLMSIVAIIPPVLAICHKSSHARSA